VAIRVNLFMVDVCGAPFLAKTPEAGQHFFHFFVSGSMGLLNASINGKLFFEFFLRTHLAGEYVLMVAGCLFHFWLSFISL
jgi:hypothetical protein